MKPENEKKPKKKSILFEDFVCQQDTSAVPYAFQRVDFVPTLQKSKSQNSIARRKVKTDNFNVPNLKDGIFSLSSQFKKTFNENERIQPIHQRERKNSVIDNLLREIYSYRSESSDVTEWSTTSQASPKWKNSPMQKSRLMLKDAEELIMLKNALQVSIQQKAAHLLKQLKLKDRLITRRDKQCDLVTAFIQALSAKRSEDTRIKFSLEPLMNDSGFSQWKDAMKMVVRLPGGIPHHFRRKLWVTLADHYLISKKVEWKNVEKFCFNEWSNPEDEDLGIQIVKDLHRTGCSTFCGINANYNQALLKKVLLAYARWNKNIGYCQGFNMLSALILESVNKKESDALKVMIFLIEGVLPEGYFTLNLRGLSVDMAVFRDLLKSNLPKLSKHLDFLQEKAKESSFGVNYEPPLTNVFTMQWFLTLFCTCLPKYVVLRIWDFIFLEGNEVLLRTALSIWEELSGRIQGARSANEFYSIMSILSREMFNFGPFDSNKLLAKIIKMAPFPFPGLNEMRDRYIFNISPWALDGKKDMQLLYSDDDDYDNEDKANKFAIAAAFSLLAFRKNKEISNSVSETKNLGEESECSYHSFSDEPDSHNYRVRNASKPNFNYEIQGPDKMHFPSLSVDKLQIECTGRKGKNTRLNNSKNTCNNSQNICFNFPHSYISNHKISNFTEYQRNGIYNRNSSGVEKLKHNSNQSLQFNTPINFQPFPRKLCSDPNPLAIQLGLYHAVSKEK